METSEKRRIVEALVLSSSEPISAAKLAEIVPSCEADEVKELVNALNAEYVEQDRSFEIWEIAGGYQIRTRAEFSGYLQKLQKERALRLSQAALETLAIIAYRQPVTRAEIEDVRGVDAGATVKSLLERHLIRIAGQREVPGRPMLYGTTRRFLEIFGLESLKSLPTLRELDELAREQGLLERTAPASDAEGERGASGADGGDDAEGDGSAFASAMSEGPDFGASELVLRHEDLPAPGASFATDSTTDLTTEMDDTANAADEFGDSADLEADDEAFGHGDDDDADDLPPLADDEEEREA
ncbi:MAG: SMC-Scp complex subunit ScpB [Myxococcota bacterium]